MRRQALDQALEQRLRVGVDPMELRLGVQPYVTLLELDYALDDFMLKLTKKSDKTVESNAVVALKRKKHKRVTPKREHNCIAIHRLDNIVYYKRLTKKQYLILKSLADGKTLGEACAEAIEASPSASTRGASIEDCVGRRGRTG